MLERDGVLDRIGDDNTYGNIDQAVEAQLPAEGGTRAGALSARGGVDGRPATPAGPHREGSA